MFKVVLIQRVIDQDFYVYTQGKIYEELAKEKLFSHPKSLHPMHHAQNTVKFTLFYKK